MNVSNRQAATFRHVLPLAVLLPLSMSPKGIDFTGRAAAENVAAVVSADSERPVLDKLDNRPAAGRAERQRRLTVSKPVAGKGSQADETTGSEDQAGQQARDESRDKARQAQQRQRELEQLEKQVRPLLEDHLPELIPLVNRLKAGQPNLYRQALMQLRGAVKRVEAAQSKSPLLREIELEALKANTQVNLIGARLQIRDSPQDRQELQQAVQRLHNAEERRLEWVVSLIEERAQRVQQQLEMANQRLEEKRHSKSQLVSDHYERLLRKAKRDRPDAPAKSSTKESKRE